MSDNKPTIEQTKKSKKEWKDMSSGEKAGATIVLVIVGFIVLGVLGAVFGDNTDTNSSTNGSQTNSETTQPVENKPIENKEPDVPAEYESALITADTYANTQHMSKQGLYDQLVSEYGEQFSAKAAKYAINNVKADWSANALATANSYQETQHMSPAAIHDQLTSEYGEQFTKAEADYAIAHLND